MKKQLSNHVLEPQVDGSIRLGIPDECLYAVYLVEFANRICISGDICLGGNENGIVSSAGYTMAWFAGQLSESYLCEKFLRQEWQWKAAVEEINSAIKFDKEGWWAEHADELKRFISSPGWKYDVPRIEEFYEFMSNLGDDCCEMLGSDYPRGQAGWLCAIQQRYSKLVELLKRKTK